jgi:hypothetical protein
MPTVPNDTTKCSRRLKTTLSSLPTMPAVPNDTTKCSRRLKTTLSSFPTMTAVPNDTTKCFVAIRRRYQAYQSWQRHQMTPQNVSSWQDHVTKPPSHDSGTKWHHRMFRRDKTTLSSFPTMTAAPNDTTKCFVVTRSCYQASQSWQRHQMTPQCFVATTRRYQAS